MLPNDPQLALFQANTAIAERHHQAAQERLAARGRTASRHGTLTAINDTKGPKMNQLSRRARSVGALLVAAAIALTVSTVAAAPRSDGAVSASAVNRTLTGGVARDLSPQELEAVNRSRGIDASAFGSR